MTKTLVAYFSASGVTEKVARNLANELKAELFEIKPAVAYTEADLDWRDKTSRSTIEMSNLNSRPEVTSKYESMDEVDTVYLGFPIWWYIAPTIVNTFLEDYDLTSKTIVLFATSGGSGFGKTVEKLQSSAPHANIKEGVIVRNSSDIQKLVEIK